MGDLRTRFDVSRARGLTRFVGRENDMQVLDQALASAHAGSGQVIGVVAEAGAGKSRLCFEFAERCRGDGMRVMQGSGVPHGKNIPLLPILQVVRAYYGISEEDDDRTARELPRRTYLYGSRVTTLWPPARSPAFTSNTRNTTER